MTAHGARMAVTLLAGLCLCACAARPMTPAMRAYSANRPVLLRPDHPLSCVPFAREHSDIAIHGDAYTWWAQARGRYAREALPRTGAIMVLNGYAGPKRGHLAVVRRIVSPREIRVDHANWLDQGNIFLNAPVIDVSADNDWSEVRVWNTRDGHMGARTYHVEGFITTFRTAALPPLS